MIHDERERREELALDALAASFFCISPDEEPEPVDDLEILDEADRQALAALGDDLVDRLLLADKPLPPLLSPPAPPGFASSFGHEPGSLIVPPEMTSLHRGDDELTESAEEEMERRRRELLDDDDEEATG
mgnify:CR=1 FL=1